MYSAARTRSDTRSAISRTRWITSSTPSAEIHDTRWPGPGSPRCMSICGRAGRCTTAKGGGWPWRPPNVPVPSILSWPRRTPPCQIHVFVGPFDFQAGDRALGRAIELNPGWPLARQYQAVSLVAQGRHREAVDQLEIAHDLDPLSGFITRFLAFAYLLNGDTSRALDTYRSARSQGPLFSTIWESEFFVRMGAIDEGFAEIKTARSSEKMTLTFVSTLRG